MLKFLKELFSQNTEPNKSVNEAVWNLKCSICGHLYRVGEDATIVTMEDVYESAASVIIMGSGNSIKKDLVASMIGWSSDRLKEGQKDARKNMQRIRNTLTSGQPRYWYCKTCGNEESPFEYREHSNTLDDSKGGEQNSGNTIRVCPPGINLSLEIPKSWWIRPYDESINESWNSRPYKHLNPFAYPSDTLLLPPQGLLSCSLAIVSNVFVVDSESIKINNILNDTILNSAEDYGFLNLKRIKHDIDDCEAAEIISFNREVAGHYMKLLELRIAKIETVKSDLLKNKKYYRLTNISYCAQDNEFETHQNTFKEIIHSLSFNDESAIGLCFDIEILQNLPAYKSSKKNYAEFAFDLFYRNISDTSLNFSQVYTGDVLPNCKYYCIKIISPDHKACKHIREKFEIYPEEDGFAPSNSRFLTGLDIEEQPLIFKGVFSKSQFLQS